MSGVLGETYHVRFTCLGDDGYCYEAKFTAHHPDHVKSIVSAMAAYNSGDDCECFINGEKVVLDGDWGLL